MPFAGGTARAKFRPIPSWFAGAAPGPLLQAEFCPLTGAGRLRVTYNWLQSALNCDPSDTKPFAWTVNKLDDWHVSLSPLDGYEGRTIFASMRDDLNWRLQVQVPCTGEWITGVSRDEAIGCQPQGDLVVSLTGFNACYISVVHEPTLHAGQSGCRLQSVCAPDPKSRLWFMAINQVLQPGMRVHLRAQVTDADIRDAFAHSGQCATDTDIARLCRLLA